MHNSGAANAILADKVQAKGVVTNVGVTGSVTVSGNSTRGGLVNELDGGVVSGSHSYADVGVSAGETGVGAQDQWGVGGLIGYVASGQVLASHATGNVTFSTTSSNTWDSQGRRYVGGLVGRNAGTVYASYAWGDVRASENYRANQWSGTAGGGLIGRVDSGGTVRAGYATGSVARTGTAIVRTHNNFGSAVGESGGTINYVYGSGAVTTSGTEQNPTGTSKQTETALKTPTGYTGIYANWNFDIDDADDDNTLTTGTDDPWDFGTSSQLPVFDYTPEGGTALPPAQLRPASLTLTASSTTVAEGGTTTITASLASSKTYAVRFTQPDNETRYTYDITVAKGGTSATGTFTSVENTTPTSDFSAALTGSRTYPAKPGGHRLHLLNHRRTGRRDPRHEQRGRVAGEAERRHLRHHRDVGRAEYGEHPQRHRLRPGLQAQHGQHLDHGRRLPASPPSRTTSRTPPPPRRTIYGYARSPPP